MLVLSMTVMAVGCAYVPMQEMSDARQAIQAAHYIAADSYVPTTLAIATQNLTEAEQNLEIGKFVQAQQSAIIARDQAVSAYKMTRAIKRVQKVWQEITLLGYSTSTLSPLLEKAQLAARQNHFEKTIAFAQEAYDQSISFLQILRDNTRKNE